MAPVLSTPLAGAVNQDTSLVLDWEASQDAAEYQVQLATDSLFSGLVVDSTLTGTQLSVDGLAYLTRYYWRVRAINLGGESEWSDYFGFTTIIEAPVTPSLVSPEDSLSRVNSPVTFVWNAAERAESYVFELSEVDDFSTLVVDESVADTSLEVTDLDPFTRYYWRVQSVNEGGESSYSVARTFETAAIPASVPALLSPANQAADLDTAFTLVFSSAPGAVSYQYQLSDTTDFSRLVASGEGTDTTATVSGLEYLTNYYWRARAIGAQDTSDWSAAFGFTTKIAAPAVAMLNSPEDGATAQPLSLNLEWGAADRAASYVVELSASSDFSDPLVQESTTDTVYFVSGLENLTSYYWRVQSVNSTASSAFSAAWSFETKALDASIPALLSPANQTVDLDTALTLVFSSAPGAVSYEYQLSDTTDFSRLVASGEGTDTTATVSGLEYLTSYYWRARAIGAQDTSDWSAAFSFATKIAAPAAPLLSSPEDGSTAQPLSLNLVWVAANRAASYLVELSASSDFSDPLVQESTTDTSYFVSGLENLTSYYWRVQSVNATASSAFSEAWTFETKALDASIPTLLSPANQAADLDTALTLVFSSAPGAVSYEYQLSDTTDFSRLVAGDIGSDTTASITGLEYLATYFWRA